MLAKRDRVDRTHLSQVFIGGEWRASASTISTPIVCPTTEVVIGDVVNGTARDIDAAIHAAREAFDHGPWPEMSLEDRCDFLIRLADALRSRVELLGYAWTEQVGILYSFSKATRGKAIDTINQYVALAQDFSFIEQCSTFAPAGYLVREPVGVVAAIAPWNSPLLTVLHKIVPALIAGCTVIVKPAPEAPLEAYIIASCVEEVGFPPGVFNLVVADRDVSSYLVQSSLVDKVSFTGSLKAGKKIAAACAERIGRLTLELGGKSAAIILDDFDLDLAASSISKGISLLAGQNCAALTRLIISRKRHDAFVERLIKQFAMLRVGDPYDPQSDMGPLAMKRQLEQVKSFVTLGQSEGARLMCGGQMPHTAKAGFFFEPTVFVDVNSRMKIAQEEIFGPVVCVIPCDDQDDAIRIANDSQFGLAGAIYTQDSNVAMRLARRIRTGTVAQSNPWADFAIGFGGFKQSGLGREGGMQGLLPYLESKTVLLTSKISACA